MLQDKYTDARLAGLHPKARNTFQAFLNEAEETLGITLRITQGLRTFAEEDALYAKGRTAPGSIVTNCKGGQSYHNYGLAIDVCQMTDNDTVVNWSYDDSTLNPIAEKYGIEWGGNFRSIKDKPHFQLTFGYSWQDLLALHNAGQLDEDGYVIIDENHGKTTA